MAEAKGIGTKGDGKDLTGRTFGRWTAISLVGPNSRGALLWLCRCECGTEKRVTGGTLRNGTSRSCGCLNREINLARITKHGMHKSPEYQAWADMKTRCLNPRHRHYADYGGRGIRVCEQWMAFENFYADMGPRPSKRHSIDRKDNYGNYEPGNCRWAEPRPQSHNRRSNHLITCGGETLAIAAWADRLGCSPTTIHKRLYLGWTESSAVSTPIDRRFRNHKAATAYCPPT